MPFQPRYEAKEGSVLGHGCCFGATVVDNTPADEIPGAGGTFAETWSLEDAERIARALNQADTDARPDVEGLGAMLHSYGVDGDTARTIAQALGPMLLDAERWQALIGSARVRVLGSAGLTSAKDPNGNPWNGYAHIGLELWTRHDAPSNPIAITWLTKYADIARLEGLGVEANIQEAIDASLGRAIRGADRYTGSLGLHFGARGSTLERDVVVDSASLADIGGLLIDINQAWGDQPG
jgi:hypothetical protein